MSQKGYLIAEAKVSDPAAYEGYKLLAERAIAQYGGRYLVRGGGLSKCSKAPGKTSPVWSSWNSTRSIRRNAFIIPLSIRQRARRDWGLPK